MNNIWQPEIKSDWRRLKYTLFWLGILRNNWTKSDIQRKEIVQLVWPVTGKKLAAQLKFAHQQYQENVA